MLQKKSPLSFRERARIIGEDYTFIFGENLGKPLIFRNICHPKACRHDACQTNGSLRLFWQPIVVAIWSEASQRSLQIRYQIINMLDADREAQHVFADTGLFQFFRIQLPVCGRGRMRRQ